MRFPRQTALFLTAALAAATPAYAGDVEQARTLFEQGVADLEAGSYDKACPAIDRSYKLDPRPGTLFTLAECEARRGRVATAVGRYTEFLALYKQFAPKKQAEQKDRADTSRAQIASLTPAMPLLTLTLPADAPADLVVKHDGEVLPRLSLAAPLAVDPGVNLFTVEIPGQAPIEHRVDLAKGARVTLALRIAPEPAPVHTATASAPSATAGVGPSATASAGPTAPTATFTGAPPVPSASVAPDNRPYRFAIAVSGGIGATALLAGVVTGVAALDRKGVRDRDCHRVGEDYACASTEGLSAGEQLKTLGGVSTAGFVLGAAGLATAGILFLAMPSSSPPRTGAKPRAQAIQVRITPVGLSVSGRL